MSKKFWTSRNSCRSGIEPSKAIRIFWMERLLCQRDILCRASFGLIRQPKGAGSSFSKMASPILTDINTANYFPTKEYLKSWADPQNSYFDKTEEMNIQKLMIERLMKEPLHDPLNEI